MSKRVTTEEARGLDYAAVNTMSDGRRITTIHHLAHTVVALEAERDEARRMLARCTQISGADCDGNDPEGSGYVHLWRTAVEAVRILRANYDEEPTSAELVAERDLWMQQVRRLNDILACERGERAPEGWVFDRRSASWLRGPYHIKQEGPGSWEVHRGPDQPNDLLFDAVNTALEAIEAADLAEKEKA